MAQKNIADMTVAELLQSLVAQAQTQAQDEDTEYTEETEDLELEESSRSSYQKDAESGAN